jgi:Protein of unknown function (DUF2971)
MFQPIHPQLINLTGADLRKPIYRVFTLERLLAACTTKRNTLVKPKKWDDPFENFVLTQAIKANPSHPSIGVKERFYGQCWSRERESDAMWRIYSPGKEGVKVRTTIGKLLTSLNVAKKKPQGFGFIGRVEYRDSKKLLKNLQDEQWLGQELQDASSQARSLLFKRTEFKHEKEVRLLYLAQHSDPSDIFAYSWEPRNVIDEIEFDPRISDHLLEAYKQYVSKTLKFGTRVKKSKLYTLPTLNFVRHK